MINNNDNKKEKRRRKNRRTGVTAGRKEKRTTAQLTSIEHQPSRHCSKGFACVNLSNPHDNSSDGSYCYQHNTTREDTEAHRGGAIKDHMANRWQIQEG